MMKPKHLLLVGFIVAVLTFYFDNKETNDLERHALTQLNLRMTGVVDSVDKLNGYNGTGVIRLKILSTNVTNYDPRNKLKYYYCIIKNGVAEVYDGHANTRYRKRPACGPRA